MRREQPSSHPSCFYFAHTCQIRNSSPCALRPAPCAPQAAGCRDAWVGCRGRGAANSPGMPGPQPRRDGYFKNRERVRTEKSKPRFWGNATQNKPKVKKKYMFRAYFDTYLKTHFVASWSFWYGCKNDLQKYFFLPLVSGLRCTRFWVWVFLCGFRNFVYQSSKQLPQL